MASKTLREKPYNIFRYCQRRYYIYETLTSEEIIPNLHKHFEEIVV